MEKKAFRISAAVLSAVIAALVWLNVSVKKEKAWDVSHPMANAVISWEQTFYSGGWSGRK